MVCRNLPSVLERTSLGQRGLGRDDQKKILKELPESVDGGANMETRVQQKKKGENVEEKHRLSV